MSRILSLAMIKMEKNFVAHIDKDYPRRPHSEYPIFSNGKSNLLAFVLREMDELTREMYSIRNDGFGKEKLYSIMLEVADVSNTLDYLFEGLLAEYHSLEDTATSKTS